MDRKFTSHSAPGQKASSKPGASPEPAAAKPAGLTKPAEPRAAGKKAKEIGGPEGPEPTRYGDWEIKGRCIDF